MKCAASPLDLFQDIGSASRPDERFRVAVVAIDVISDGYDQFF